MKKTIKSLLALAVAAFAFTACSDVPEPEGYNSRQGDGLIDYTPEGVGTLASPYNVAGVLQATKDLAKGAKTGEIYTKGFVSKREFSSQYGSFNYYITDNKEGKSKAFYVYSGIGLNKEKFTSENDLNVGDAVTICGTIVNFNGTIEYEKQNYLVELNGKTAGGGGGGSAGTGSGTETDPYDVAAAIAAGSAKTDSTQPVGGCGVELRDEGDGVPRCLYRDRSGVVPQGAVPPRHQQRGRVPGHRTRSRPHQAERLRHPDLHRQHDRPLMGAQEETQLRDSAHRGERGGHRHAATRRTVAEKQRIHHPDLQVEHAAVGGDSGGFREEVGLRT